MAFIAATQAVEETAGQLRFEVTPCGQRFAINKWASTQDYVAAAMCSDGGGWNHEVVAELQNLVGGAVAVKARKLRNVPKPCVLLLLDRYHFNRPQDYEVLRGRLTPEWGIGAAAAEFQSIYLIQADGAVFPLRELES
jgi:hypothetical protein